MKRTMIKLKKKSLNNIVLIKDTINAFIQPFKQMPSIGGKGMESPDRINAHDLFGHYTADIIEEDTIFTR